MECTWKDCTQEATVPQIAKDKEVWANLCADHHNEIEEAIHSLDPKTLLSCWVRAMGGAKEVVKRM